MTDDKEPIEQTKFHQAYNVNCKAFVENVEGKTYLTWSTAWREFKRIYPDATYEIVRASNGLPYVCDPVTGYMVFTKMNADGVTHEMFLPVLDNKFKPLKSTPLEYDAPEYIDRKPTGKRITKTIAAATMFDINKALMRCLVKNMAMFGLGLYIYEGEDLPVVNEEDLPPPPKTYLINVGKTGSFHYEEWLDNFINVGVKKCKDIDKLLELNFAAINDVVQDHLEARAIIDSAINEKRNPSPAAKAV